MNYRKKTVRDIDVKGKKVLLRCDFNVPQDKKTGAITSDKRIVAALPTIRYLLEQGAAVIACSHLGKPEPDYDKWVKKQTEKGKNPAELTRAAWETAQKKLTLAPVAVRLGELLGQDVQFAHDVVGTDAQAKAAALKPGDVLLLTKPLGVGVLTTAAKAGLVEETVMQRIYRQMAALNKTARDIMVKYRVHSCTDVTGFALLGHSFEMAQGSGCTVHIRTSDVPYHPEAWELADMGFLPAGAYRNRDYAEAGVTVRGGISRTIQDLLYDPQTSGGLLMAVAEKDAEVCLRELRDAIPTAAAVGYVTEKQDSWIVLE